MTKVETVFQIHPVQCDRFFPPLNLEHYISISMKISSNKNIMTLMMRVEWDGTPSRWANDSKLFLWQCSGENVFSGIRPSSIPHHLCNLGQVTQPLWTSVSSMEQRCFTEVWELCFVVSGPWLALQKCYYDHCYFYLTLEGTEGSLLSSLLSRLQIISWDLSLELTSRWICFARIHTQLTRERKFRHRL